MKISLSVEGAAFAKFEKSMNRIIKQYEQAEASALTRTAGKGKTRLVKEMRTAHSLPAKSIRKRVKVKGANRRRREARLWIGTYDIPLIERSGIGGALVPHAFIATMKSGHEGWFRRKTLTTTRIGKGARKGRRNAHRRGALPINEQMIDIRVGTSGRIQRITDAVMREELPRILEQRIRYYRNRG